MNAKRKCVVLLLMGMAVLSFHVMKVRAGLGGCWNLNYHSCPSNTIGPTEGCVLTYPCADIEGYTGDHKHSCATYPDGWMYCCKMWQIHCYEEVTDREWQLEEGKVCSEEGQECSGSGSGCGVCTGGTITYSSSSWTYYVQQLPCS